MDGRGPEAFAEFWQGLSDLQSPLSEWKQVFEDVFGHSFDEWANEKYEERRMMFSDVHGSLALPSDLVPADIQLWAEVDFGWGKSRYCASALDDAGYMIRLPRGMSFSLYSETGSQQCEDRWFPGGSIGDGASSGWSVTEHERTTGPAVVLFEGPCSDEGETVPDSEQSAETEETPRNSWCWLVSEATE